MSEEIYKRAIAALFNCSVGDIFADTQHYVVVIKTRVGELTLPNTVDSCYSFAFHFNEIEEKIFRAMSEQHIKKILGVDATKSGNNLWFRKLPDEFWKKIDIIYKKVKLLSEKFIEEFVTERIEAWLIAREMKE